MRYVTAMLLAALVTPATAQQAQPGSPGDGAQAEADLAVRLGRRAGQALAARGVIPALVIVPDPASYAEAIARWTPAAIFPVLIDDGSWGAGENVARFVRGFRPERVVRWKSEQAPTGAALRPRRAIEGARDLADGALARSWGVGEGERDRAGALMAVWLTAGREPPGVIVADDRDAAWTAALALAAGRGEPIMWARLPKLAVDAPMTAEEIEPFIGQIEQFCAETKLPWNGLGDAIDAVTICAGLPGRVQTSPEEFIATTDLIGRRAQGRWAWAGQVFGSEPDAAYRAMCTLFLRLRTAWLFDGYGSAEPWGQWDCTAAGKILTEAGLFATVDDEPRNTLGDWKLRAERPVRGDLIMVNSSGNRSWFDLGSGRAQAGDIPMLDAPSAMHMVHSWSAVAPGRRETVAGRWLERGVYAYVGSVHEPFLQGFVPTPTVAARLMSGAALGAAVRVPDRPIWRIAVLADPLLAHAPDAPRLAPEPPVDGAEDVEESMKSAAGEQEYARAAADLAILGRDGDAARLFAAVLRERPEAIKPQLARAALFPLFRTGMDEEFLRAYGALSAEDAADGAAVDALWHVGRRVAREGGDYREAAITLMTAHIREDQRAEDARELSGLGAGRP
ncbi:MAG TPA: hypothetical protein VFF69_04800 [Phycisphaerales bacterium]|nr:hypothetical protein [Phycisphaerales bacterium]